MSEFTPKIRPLLSAEKIATRVAELGNEISADFAGKIPTVIIITNGAMFFAVDLIRAISVPVRIECVRISSYQNDIISSGEPLVLGMLPQDSVSGKDILVVDDISDTGKTLEKIKSVLLASGALSVKSCVLLDKPSRRSSSVTVDYSGFEVDDVFVVGYGLDYAGTLRELPYIGAVV